MKAETCFNRREVIQQMLEEGESLQGLTFDFQFLFFNAAIDHRPSGRSYRFGLNPEDTEAEIRYWLERARRDFHKKLANPDLL